MIVREIPTVLVIMRLVGQHLFPQQWKHFSVNNSLSSASYILSIHRIVRRFWQEDFFHLTAEFGSLKIHAEIPIFLQPARWCAPHVCRRMRRKNQSLSCHTGHSVLQLPEPWVSLGHLPFSAPNKSREFNMRCLIRQKMPSSPLSLWIKCPYGAENDGSVH